MADNIIFTFDFDASKAGQTLGELKTNLKELKKELDNTAIGSQAFKGLEDKIKAANVQVREINQNLKGFTPEQLTKQFASFGQTVAGAFSTAVGAIGLF